MYSHISYDSHNKSKIIPLHNVNELGFVMKRERESWLRGMNQIFKSNSG